VNGGTLTSDARRSELPAGWKIDSRPALLRHRIRYRVRGPSPITSRMVPTRRVRRRLKSEASSRSRRPPRHPLRTGTAVRDLRLTSRTSTSCVAFQSGITHALPQTHSAAEATPTLPSVALAEVTRRVGGFGRWTTQPGRWLDGMPSWREVANCPDRSACARAGPPPPPRLRRTPRLSARPRVGNSPEY
jgi:hypothetical protein